jgi:hypothetical protein
MVDVFSGVDGREADPEALFVFRDCGIFYRIDEYSPF